MLDISKIPQNILDQIRESKPRETVSKMSPAEAFDAFCNWNGIIRWSGTLINTLDALRAAEIKPASLVSCQEEYDKLPDRHQLDDYVQNGYPVGGFLRAIICNDLQRAFGKVDNRNLPYIGMYVKYLYNQCPAECFGSEHAMQEWLIKKAKKA